MKMFFKCCFYQKQLISANDFNEVESCFAGSTKYRVRQLNLVYLKLNENHCMNQENFYFSYNVGTNLKFCFP